MAAAHGRAVVNARRMTMVSLLFRRLQDVGAGVGGVAQAGASIVDTEATNAANLELQSRANQFNAQQAGIQRAWSGQQAQNQMDFNAAQAGLNRSFQDTEQTKAEAYNTQMSNTAIQRRAADLATAGFNPLLAVSQLGGASTPNMSAPSGSTATAGLPSGASAQAVQPPQMRGAVGPAIAALDSSMQRDLLRAQAGKTAAEAETIRQTLPYAGAQAAANVQRTNADIDNLVAQANKALSEYDINENTIPNLLQDRQFRAQLQQGLMELQSLDIQAKKYGNSEGAARADVFNSPLGRYLVVAGLGHQAGGDVGAAAATALWKLYNNPVKPATRSAMDVQINDPTGAHMLEESGISAPTP